MTLPKPLVLFLAFCGGAAFFAAPLLLFAFVFGTGAPRSAGSGVSASEPPAAQASPSAAPDTGEVIGELTFTAFDLGFDPASVEVAEPGR